MSTTRSATNQTCSSFRRMTSLTMGAQMAESPGRVLGPEIIQRLHRQVIEVPSMPGSRTVADCASTLRL